MFYSIMNRLICQESVVKYGKNGMRYFRGLTHIGMKKKPFTTIKQNSLALPILNREPRLFPQIVQK